ncbi:MAG: dTMP kinase [Verrucomicrobiota bacterium]|nr:dTMP kinase [Verrucomicrobiota bacterium]
MTKGMLITFEGNEGSGKSTQIKLLTERLQAAGRQVTSVREPGGTGLGELLRDILKNQREGVHIDPIAELLMMNASRAQLVQEVIRPALKRNKIVLVDRFFDSTIVYQGHGRGLDLDLVREVVKVAIGSTLPLQTYLLRVPLETSETRRAQRSIETGHARDRFEASERAFFERIERGYDTIARREPDRIRVIDATLPIEEVHAAIWSCFPKPCKPSRG